MKAELVHRERTTLTENAFFEIVIWRVPTPVAESEHNYKYRLAFIHRGDCLFRYDNEAGKGDHKHIGTHEVFYRFDGPEQLIEDFMADIADWRQSNGYVDDRRIVDPG